MKSTTNVFLKGMTSDMHPLTTSLLEYTDALNATLITFNGNELMIQNDMGNTKIQDSKTGNIMGLREGFIPIGLKEHGGIMYIASVNKDGVGEIGTIPSPVIRYNNKENSEISDTVLSASPNILSELIKITNHKVYPGERFAVAILSPESSTLIQIPIENQPSEEYPFYSTLNKKGLYAIKLYSQTDDQIFDLSDVVENEKGAYGYQLTDPELLTGYLTWYASVINDQSVGFDDIEFDIDTMNILDNNSDEVTFLHYPNIPAGYPSIRIEPEKLSNFYLLPHSESEVSYPLTFFDSSANKYQIAIPGFIYETDSAVHVNKIVYSIVNERTNETVDLIIKSDGSITNKHTLNLDENYKRFKLNSTKFLISVEDPTTESDILSNVSDKNIISYFLLPREELNTWFTLTATYYSSPWNNEPIGTYQLKFNLFVMDILKNFYTFDIVPEDFSNEFLSSPSDYLDGFIRQEYSGPDSETEPPINELNFSVILKDNFFGKDDWYSKTGEIDKNPVISKNKYHYLYRSSDIERNLGQIEISTDEPNNCFLYFYILQDANQNDWRDTFNDGNAFGDFNLTSSFINISAKNWKFTDYIDYGPNTNFLSNIYVVDENVSKIEPHYNDEHVLKYYSLKVTKFGVGLDHNVSIVGLQLSNLLPIDISTSSSKLSITFHFRSNSSSNDNALNPYLQKMHLFACSLGNCKIKSKTNMSLNLSGKSKNFVCPLYNLIGKNEFIDEDKVPYGYSPKYLSFEPVNLILEKVGDTYTHGGVMSLFVIQYDVQPKNSIDDNIRLYKIKNGTISGNKPGLYFIHFNLKNPRLANKIKFVIYNGSDEPDDAVTHTLHKDGNVFFFPTQFTLKLKIEGLSSFESILVQSGGLYEVDYNLACDLNEALLNDFDLNTVKWTSNKDYKYVVPQLCWGFDESEMSCGTIDNYEFINSGRHGFQAVNIASSNYLKPNKEGLISSDEELYTAQMPEGETHYNQDVKLRKYIGS